MPRHPTFARTLLMITVIVVSTFFIFTVFGLITSPPIPEKTRLELGRWGLVLSYLSAIVAMNGLFHDGEVLSDQRKLESKLEYQEGQLSLIKSLQLELPSKFEGRVREIQDQIKEAQAGLKLLSKYPVEMRKTYWLSGAMLVVGTTLQLVSLG